MFIKDKVLALLPEKEHLFFQLQILKYIWVIKEHKKASEPFF